MKSLLRFRAYLRPYLGSMVIGMLASVLVAVATAGVAALLKPMFNDVFYLGAASEAAASPIPDMGLSTLDSLQKSAQDKIAWFVNDVIGYEPSRAYLFVPAFFVLAFLVKSLFTYVSSYRLGMVGLRVVKDLRTDLYTQIQRQSLKFFTAHPTGLLTTRVTSDVAMLQEIVGTQMAEVLRLLFSLLFLSIAAMILDWRLFLVCTVVLPITVYPAARFASKIKRSTATSQSRLADLADRLQETITGRRVVRSFNTEAFEIDRFSSVLGGMLHADRRALKYRSLTQPVIEITGAMAMGVIAGFAGWRISRGDLNPGDFVATLAALYWIYAILKHLARYGNELTRAAAAAERVFSVLDRERDVMEVPDAPGLAPFRDVIRFENARFSYVGEPVLNGVDLTIRRGEKVALVGPSGAGKSTLVNLVPRFYDVTGGSVSIDGKDVRKVSLRSLREQIGLVTQEIVLFNDTVRNNIAYGKHDAGAAEVEAAARAAHAHEFIDRLPQGYDTILGEAAQSLSRGQRQRIAIARALLKQAPILILDEATSALDAESESLVQEALGTLLRDRTAIIIAHRLATVRSADRIVVLEAGKMVEEGAHDELLRRGGIYARLYRMQFATSPDAAPSPG